MKASVLYVIGVSLALAAAAAQAQQYKWKDSRGRWQYGDVPPAGVQAIPLKPPPGPPAPAATGEGGAKGGDAAAAAKSSKPLTPAEQELEYRRRLKEAQEKAAKEEKLAKEERERKENCQLAREQVAALGSGQRIARYDVNGNRYYINDAQRAQELSQARSSVGQWCK